MHNRLVFWTFCLCIWSFCVQAQDDPVLFTVENSPVHLSEFKYIYSKTNGDKADFSRNSLEEYMDLYVKFKLKVQRARDMKLDTIPSLQNELEGYRKQLANSYLVDKEVTERLVKEAYDRTQKDVDISHIMIRLKEGITPADTIKAYKYLQTAKRKIEGGQSFEEVAKVTSEDTATKSRGGRLGFITAMLPNGFYALESAAYDVAKGGISDIIRTNLGYHIVKVNGSRPARGEMEAAHIFIRIDDKKGITSEKAKMRIDSIHTALKGGASFEELAKTLSQDKKSSSRGGNIGFFGINRYEATFENAAFALDKDADYTQPLKTKAGWHIVKRISKKQNESFDIAKRRLQTKIQGDTRYTLAKNTMVGRIKKENNFREESSLIDNYLKALKPDFLTYKWKPTVNKEERTKVLFSFGQMRQYTIGEFEAFIQRASRQRLRAARDASPAEIGRQLYNEYIGESAIRFEESQLEDKYPEFKALMREYREGILLFEATKNLVWDKASQDTVGLAKFHETIKDKYKWEERALASVYTISPEGGSKVASKVAKCAKKRGVEKVMKDLGKNKQFVAHQEKTLEKQDPLLTGMNWKAGTVSDLTTNKANRSQRFVKIEKIIPPTTKSLSEARGYIIADYQDHLEKQWVKELQKTYKVNVNKDVFEGMVAK